MDRRSFITTSAKGAIGASFALSLTSCFATKQEEELFFKISLAEWSLNRTIHSGKLTNLQFPLKAKNDFGINAVEYVNTFFFDKAKDKAYLKELKTITETNGIENVLIMIDAEGAIGDIDAKKRKQAIENHYKWVEAAQFLGCHSIRVNTAKSGSKEEVSKASIEGLHQLSTFAKDYDINILVENHGGHSSDGQWLSNVINKVDLPNCGTLPDFGNFYEYDRYQGVKDMMPLAKAVSAKTMEFNLEGDEIGIDYVKMLQIVKDSGYRGHIGIEFEGDANHRDEDLGIRITKELLLKSAGKLI